MCGGTLGQVLGLNTEQANKLDSFEEIGKAITTNAMYGAQSLGLPSAPTAGDMVGAVAGMYGANDSTTTTDTTTDNTPSADLQMTPEERRNNLRRLMASRYGRAQTVLTGGTGISGFGV